MILLFAFRTDKRGYRNPNDARKLYSDLASNARMRRVVEYLDDKKVDQTKSSQESWLPGTRQPWWVHMRRAFKETLRHFSHAMQPKRSTNRDIDPFRHKCSRILIAEACSSIQFVLLCQMFIASVCMSHCVCLCVCTRHARVGGLHKWLV